MKPTADQIEAMLDRAEENENKYPHRSYDEGVAAALAWVMGADDPKRIEVDPFAD